MNEPAASAKPSRVFLVVRAARFDVSAAAEFGEVAYLLGENVVPSPFASDDLSDEILAAFYRRSFDPFADRIAMTGPVIHVTLCVAIALSSFGFVRVLMYDARCSSYVERSFRSRSIPSAREAKIGAGRAAIAGPSDRSPET